MRSACFFTRLLLILIFVSTLTVLNAQNKTDSANAKKKIASFEKSVFVGTDFNGHLLIGFSGPQLMFAINDHTKIGPCYYPSLWWNYNTGEFDTKLGVGARVDHKHAIVGFNTFRIGNNIWVGSLIVGVRF
ncbi:MAG: hypothetical protein WCP74_04850 [Sphingobacteriia bacterium]|jgi:hypothetical protein